MDEKMLHELQQWVTDNYDQHTTSWTAMRSQGNYDDCFEDGCDSATSWAAYHVGRILGMKLEEPDEPDEEY